MQEVTREIGNAPWQTFDADLAWSLARQAFLSGFAQSDGWFMERARLNPLELLLEWMVFCAAQNPNVPPEPPITPEEAYLADLPPGNYDTVQGTDLANAKADEVYYGTEGRGINISETVTEYILAFDMDFDAVVELAAGVGFDGDPGSVTFDMTNGPDTSSTTVTPTENPPGTFFAGEVVGLPNWWINRIRMPIAAKPKLNKIYIGPSGNSPIVACKLVVANGGGDTFDCYDVGEGLSDPNGGTAFSGGWVAYTSYQRYPNGDSFDSYAVESPITGSLNNGEGFLNPWYIS